MNGQVVILAPRPKRGHYHKAPQNLRPISVQAKVTVELADEIAAFRGDTTETMSDFVVRAIEAFIR